MVDWITEDWSAWGDLSRAHTEDVKDSKIQESLDRAAADIATLHLDERAGWITYLMEALQANTNARHTDYVLMQVDDSIGCRLREGQW